MTPSEVAALLTYAAAFDNRTPSESAAKAWAEALDERMTLTDAKNIVRDHYADTPDWVMPAHINRKNRQIRDRRIRTAGNAIPFPLDLPSEISQTFEIAWKRAIGDGHEGDAAVQVACREVGFTPAPLELTGPPPTLEKFMNKIKETDE